MLKYRRHKQLFRFCILLGAALFGVFPVLIFGGDAGPLWWTNRNILNSRAENDYAAVNQGQVKNLAINAIAELNANLPGGAGDELNQQAVTLSTTTALTNDYMAVNIGQLKTIAMPLFNRLLRAGYQGHPLESGTYPWVGKEVSANDYAMANIGQLKNLFSFDITAKTHTDNPLPDWWLQHYFGGVDISPTANAQNIPGLSNYESYQLGLNPNDYYNGVEPTLEIVSGNGQVGILGQILSPLVVRVTDGHQKILASAPVEFSVSGSSATLMLSATAGSSVTSQVTRTGTDGLVQVYATLTAANADPVVTAKPYGSYSSNALFYLHSVLHSAPIISSGPEHNLAVSVDGKLWAWGRNYYGQLGVGSDIDYWFPICVDGMDNICSIGAGSYHSVVCKEDGTIWTCGYNYYGQLGTSTNLGQYGTPNTTFVQLPNMSGFTAVAAGDKHTLALKSDGTVWAWGWNSYGQLGDGTSTDRSAPVQVIGLTNVVAIAASTIHSIALKNDGTVWAWGYGGDGELGNDSSNSSNTPVQTSATGSMVSISCGYYYNLAVRNDGTVWTWGLNGRGQLGDGTTNSRNKPVQVSGLNNVAKAVAGRQHGVALKNDGSVVAWGDNSYGQLGDGTTTQRRTPVAVVSSSGTGNLNGIQVVSAGDNTIASGTDGSIFGWGRNNFGQIGNEQNADTSLPVILTDFTLERQAAAPTLSPAGGAYLTAQSAIVSCTTPEAVIHYRTDGTMPNKNDLIINSGSTISINATGELRTKAFSPGQVSSRTKNASYIIGSLLSAGINHSLAVTPDGQLWSWGYNYYGQLGSGTNVNGLYPVQVNGVSGLRSVAAGELHSVICKNDGTVWACGRNYTGQLGIATNYQSSTANALFVQIPNLTGFVSVSAGDYHTLALKGDGTVWAWGDNSYGKLGDGTTTSRYTPMQVQGLDHIIAVSAGNSHSVALKDDGSVWGWGYNGYGQLGVGTYNNYTSPVCLGTIRDVIEISCGSNFTVALKADGTVYAWGNGGSGQLGAGGDIYSSYVPIQVPGLTRIVQVAAGQNHTVALKSDGTVWGWGGNQYGQLGQGNSGSDTNQFSPVLINGLNGITAISAGNNTLAFRNDGTVWAFGNNQYGQLGNNSTTKSNVPVAVEYIATAPAAPSGLQGSFVSKTYHLTWTDNSDNEEHFIVQHSSNGGTTWSDIGSVGSNVTSFDYLAWEENDNFRVVAERYGARSNPSNVNLVTDRDQDGDGMSDIWEIKNGLNPDDPSDKSEDLDRDGYPNVYEYTHSADPQAALSVPVADVFVNKTGTSGTSIAYTTIQNAIDSITNDYKIIRVDSGTYNENLTMGTHSVLLISSSGAATTIISGTSGGSVIGISSDVVINGFTITSGSGTQNGTSGTGGGVFVQGGSPRLTNCVVKGNSAAVGAAIYSSGSSPVLLNCTVAGNSSSSGAAIAVASGSMTVTNTILWNPAVSSEISGTGLTASYSDIRGGLTGTGNINAAPLLTADFHLNPTSPCRGIANFKASPLVDIDGDPRGANSSDIGADEFGLPQWWQIQYFGHLGIDPNADNMGDGLTNFQKWQQGLDPTVFHYSASSDTAPDIGILTPSGVTLLTP